MQSVNEIVSAIHKLPRGEQERIRRLLLEEQKEKDEQQQKQLEDYAKAKKWIAENREKYMNQWVCLEGDKLIAHSADGREVYRKAREAGIKAPFIHHIHEEPEAFWGGWL